MSLWYVITSICERYYNELESLSFYHKPNNKAVLSVYSLTKMKLDQRRFMIFGLQTFICFEIGGKLLDMTLIYSLRGLFTSVINKSSEAQREDIVMV